MNLILLSLAFCAGAAISLQAGVNSQLAIGLGNNSIAAALVSFFCGTVILALAATARGGLGSALAAVQNLPAWKLTGGLLGAGFLFSTVFLAPRMGLTNMLVLVIAGQLIASLLIDHFGLLHVMIRPVSWIKLSGAVAVLVGVTLTLFGDRLCAPSMGAN